MPEEGDGWEMIGEDEDKQASVEREVVAHTTGVLNPSFRRLPEPRGWRMGLAIEWPSLHAPAPHKPGSPLV